MKPWVFGMPLVFRGGLPCGLPANKGKRDTRPNVRLLERTPFGPREVPGAMPSAQKKTEAAGCRHRGAANGVARSLEFRSGGIGVPFRLVWLEIDGTGLGGFISFTRAIYFTKRSPMSGGLSKKAMVVGPQSPKMGPYF